MSDPVCLAACSKTHEGCKKPTQKKQHVTNWKSEERITTSIPILTHPMTFATTWQCTARTYSFTHARKTAITTTIAIAASVKSVAFTRHCVIAASVALASNRDAWAAAPIRGTCAIAASVECVASTRHCIIAAVTKTHRAQEASQ